MNTFIISYELKRSDKNYNQLYESILSISMGKFHLLDTSWIIRSSHSALEICEKLGPHIDPDDKLIVAHLTGEASWKGFGVKGSQWLRSNL